MNSLNTCLLLAGAASVALAAPSGGLQLGARASSNTTDSCPYTVQMDDNCYFIAVNRFGIEPAEFSRLNGGKFDKDCIIFPGQEVRVPCDGKRHVDDVDVSGKCLLQHVVEAGDTCYSISLGYNIAAHVLQAYNGNLDSKCSIQPGDKICVSKKRSLASCVEHVVVVGDSCYDIAEKNGITLLDLQAWNPDLINDRCAIRPGHEVCVGHAAAPAADATVAPAADATVAPAANANAAPAANANAAPIVKLSVQAKAQIKIHLQSYVGNLTVAPSGGDAENVLLPSQSHLVSAIASVSFNKGEADTNAPFSGAVAPNTHLFASTSVLGRIFDAVKVDFHHTGCAAGKCTVVVTSPTPVTANANGTPVTANANGIAAEATDDDGEVDADSCSSV
ncbi:hypothetical protein G6O67_000894 [Ophiocordyceps sinensis]|uniref:LysM domain-containing protein n=2 Tax=Ophiocordyceps sinensis TaxID=72228 RepID=A0A8H4VA44_9HYPO|nr:Peptidoglycan-binding lysin domain protein [Ophiocordyceps sinensis CO18]KAF4513647.1 hypothetical protein G6O67_000894 [Ophiocordyceps sinensis]